MSALSLPDLFVLAAACGGPAVPEGRIKATAHVESGFQTFAIHDNADDRAYVPNTLEAAVAKARELLAKGHRIDAGVMQITDRNWGWLGLDAVTVFDESRNVCAAVRKMQADMDAEARLSNRYNCGQPVCRSMAYANKIEAAWWGPPPSTSGQVLTPVPRPPAPAEPEPPLVDAVIHKRR